MLVACRLAGLSALDAHYAGVNARAMRADAALRRGLPGNGGYLVCRTSTVRGETPDGHDGWSGNEGSNFLIQARLASSYRPVAFSTVAMATICRSSVICFGGFRIAAAAGPLPAPPCLIRDWCLRRAWSRRLDAPRLTPRALGLSSALQGRRKFLWLRYRRGQGCRLRGPALERYRSWSLFARLRQGWNCRTRVKAKATLGTADISLRRELTALTSRMSCLVPSLAPGLPSFRTTTADQDSSMGGARYDIPAQEWRAASRARSPDHIPSRFRSIRQTRSGGDAVALHPSAPGLASSPRTSV